jgi:hypothetical protein
MALVQRQDSFIDTDYVSCQAGGQWAKCDDPNHPTFIGCCSSDPCSGQMCLDSDLYPMSFGNGTDSTPDYPNHSCPYGGLWYTCADNSPTFQGCCKSNPCNGEGCPAGDLVAAGVHTVNVAGMPTFTVPSSVATAASTSDISPTVSATPPPPDASTSPLALPVPSSRLSNTAAIAGVAAAVAVFVTILVGLTVYCIAGKRAEKARIASTMLETGQPSPPEHKFVPVTDISRTGMGDFPQEQKLC